MLEMWNDPLNKRSCDFGRWNLYMLLMLEPKT